MGVGVWTGFWAGQGVKGWGPSQAACTTGQSPLLFFLIAWGLCHRTRVTGWEAGCGQGGNRGQYMKTPGFPPWLAPPSTHPSPLPNLDGPTPWLLVERVEWLNQRRRPCLLAVSSASWGPAGQEGQLRSVA